MTLNSTSPTETPNEQARMNNVAMLIDWENIKASAINSLRTPPDIITLKKIARKYGSLRVARAYANWTDSGGWHAGDAERLSAQGIEPVFVATKHFNGEYEKDLVDLRLACDGMELLSMHPEIECFVIVSGDGALETLLSKLSARGKRVVRVAVQEGCVKRLNVLGEERVLYDDWVKGFRFSKDAEVTTATGKLADAVKAIAEAGSNRGLHAVKEWMRREEPEFEEERHGIPTFRHLAYLAESLGLVRIDARKEPAQAYRPDEEIALDGAVLPSGDAWKTFIGRLDPSKVYDKAGLGSCFRDSSPGLAMISLDEMVDLALQSDVMTRVSSKHVTRDEKTWYTNTSRLNAHHPRVQVVLAGA